jgi:hypothetical protein
MGATVTVASKLPFRLELQCCVKRTQQRRFQGEVWTEEVYFKDGPIVTINGTAYPNGQVPEGYRPRPKTVGGYALTPNVPKDLFDAWLAENKDSAMIKNRLVFGYEQKDAVDGRARENTDVDSGLGPLIPDSDRRMPKKVIGRQTRSLPEAGPDYSPSED